MLVAMGHAAAEGRVWVRGPTTTQGCVHDLCWTLWRPMILLTFKSKEAFFFPVVWGWLQMHS